MRKASARKFIDFWARQKGAEDREDQKFWNSLLRDVLGVENVESFIDFQQHVRIGSSVKRLDGWIPLTRVLIEHKSRGVDLTARQAGHGGKTPYEQAKEYDDHRPVSQKARWIVTCNFDELRIHDMDQPNPAADPQIVRMCDLEREYWRLAFLADTADVHVHREEALSVEAGEIIAEIYRTFRGRYREPESEAAVRSLGVLCVRIVFCLFAEDAGLFARHSSFGDYLKRLPVEAMRSGLLQLFEVLDTPESKRDPYAGETLRGFPYVDGGLFGDRTIEVPSFDERVRQLIVERASEGFDWSEISPTIFGAVFDSTIAPRDRKSGAMHYTSVGNIRKVIGPLFLDALERELEKALAVGDCALRRRELERFVRRLGRLSFFDPACGSGNFLTETYLSLRKLENRALAELQDLGCDLSRGNVIHVRIENFHGIEINEFACSVAKASLWIAGCQMALATRRLLNVEVDCLPLRAAANIVCGNALDVDWKTVHVPDADTYVIGNPPFVGAKRMSPRQAADMRRVFAGVKNAGLLDYVAAWFEVALPYLRDGGCHAAFVATNSIVQGEQPAVLFDRLFRQGLSIDFGWRPFKWESESRSDPAVTCVIVGFHVGEPAGERVIFDVKSGSRRVGNINAYLVDGPSITVSNSRLPLCAVPEAGIGNKPIDGGHYLFSDGEKEEFLRREPRARKFFREWLGADELIYGYRRHCLFLADATPQEVRSLPEVRRRVEAVREFRLSSKSEPTRRLADVPLRFHVTNIPGGRSLVIPEVSSENREYVPMAFCDGRTLCSNLVKLVPGATEYHFGVLTSSVHMAWMRTVCGRREMRYRYSTGIVYNNFPWPQPDAGGRRRIEETAREILAVRARHRGATLDALYDPVSMPDDLRKAHRANDLSVKKAYGLAENVPEDVVVGVLLGRYEELRTESGRADE